MKAAAQTTAVQPDPWTIGRLLDWTRQHFQSRGIDDSRLCAELLLAKVLNCQKITLYTRFNEVPTDEQRAAYRDLVKKAADHHPIAYLVGRKEFYSLEFKVTPDVLIPRPETELIVERALAWVAAHPREHFRVLDIGTGSGCLAVTLARRVPGLHAIATDISPAALAVARENAAKHGVESRIQFVEADLLDLPYGLAPEGGFDLIVSNPPYVATRDAESLSRTVREYEPPAALFAGDDGLAIYRRLASGIAAMLRPGGLLLLEIGLGQADAVLDLFVGIPGLTPAGQYRDLAGIERTLAFTLSA
ncbi:MAG TPA: peptide chain release factor N(5)-glutamine methyltransferase [Phycisphaerae bacterium]|nr:peptide chain release factor N(5)-glutamine methyltransferase [Phycisphaerae bacterium]